MNPQIPTINRDGKLVTRLLPVVLVGFDHVLDKESRLYIRLLVRLVDKSFNEYMTAREYIIEETKTQDKLAHRFNIIGYLENSINAISRAIKIFEIIIYGKKIKDSNEKRKFNILNFVNSKTLKKIKKQNVSKIRNRIEHIDEDIFDNKFKRDLFLDVDEKYEKICINNKCLSLVNLASIIENYHTFVLEILLNLPNRMENGVYYYDKR